MAGDNVGRGRRAAGIGHVHRLPPAVLNISIARCAMPPTPDEPIVRSPPFDISISSFKVRAGTDGLVAITIGLFETVATPMKSFTGS